MIVIPPNIKDILKQGMKSPQGTVSLQITFEKSIYDPNEPGGIMFENIAGRHYFRLERTDDLKIKFYHASPGNGTRLAVVDISKSTPSLKAMCIFSWSHEELKLYIGPMGVIDTTLETSTTENTDMEFKVTQDEQVIEVDSANIDVMGLRVYHGNKVVLDSSAIESWNETLSAIEVMMCATSTDGYLFDIAKSNFVVVILVTGIETYCKRRLQEMESEGVTLNYIKLKEQTDLTKEEIFADTKNYFQDLNSMKKIWLNLVNINVCALNKVTWQSFKEELFPHRHIVVHAHSLRAEMNTDSNTNIVFITNELDRLKNNCVNFVQSLHEQTLSSK